MFFTVNTQRIKTPAPEEANQSVSEELGGVFLQKEPSPWSSGRRVELLPGFHISGLHTETGRDQ